MILLIKKFNMRKIAIMLFFKSIVSAENRITIIPTENETFFVMVPKANQMVDFLKTSQIYYSWCVLHIFKSKEFFNCSFYANHLMQDLLFCNTNFSFLLTGYVKKL